MKLTRKNNNEEIKLFNVESCNALSVAGLIPESLETLLWSEEFFFFSIYSRPKFFNEIKNRVHLSILLDI